MICKLCLQDEILIRKSHIISNFLYNGMFTERRSLVTTNLSDHSKDKYSQTGIYEGGILCKRCDNEIIGSYERYVSNVIYGDAREKYNVGFNTYLEHGEQLPYARFINLDYTKTKLFFLSLLWRTHISSNSFFKEVDLGEKYGEKLRKMIFAGDAGRENEFEVALMLLQTQKRFTKLMGSPMRLNRRGKNTAYVMHINGIMYHFNVSNYNKDEMFTRDCVINKSGSLDIPILENELADDYFDSYMGKVVRLKSQI